MGKPLNPEAPTTVLNFRLSSDELDRLDRLAARLGKTRAQFLRDLVVTGVEEVEQMEAVGLVRAVITVKEIVGWMADKSKKVSEDLHDEAHSKV